MIHNVMKENMSVEDYFKNNIVYKKNLVKKKLRNMTASEISELYQANKLLTLRRPRELRAHCKEPINAVETGKPTKSIRRRETASTR